MFNKEDLIKAVNDFKVTFPLLPEPILLHGGSLVVRGIKPLTNDIDVYVQDILKLMEDKLTKEPYYLSDERTYLTMYSYGEFDFGIAVNQDIDYEIIDGIKVQTLEQIIEQKKIFNRPKDHESIKMIEDYLAK